ncbi:SgcJ/EcaC family oxidoreductase [Kribbella antibiotica]|uniref:SgcJ/EcaC family oxidoreductase n=1 Tax=Kribbella antibiotica TaxID=190195 RepID=A0A4R4ZJD9_9ACTN|nr:SgcJ/EcaC family oxidoreductase [Kribbella antibiotica]TDD58861.1 SgcJ/EcaC family oxidoreductase [Kribbella antibiotica]
MTGEAARTTDTDRTRAVWATMARGWKAGSAELFASIFAEDVDFISVRGTAEKGRERVRARHALLFEGQYRDTVLEIRPDLVRHLRGGAVIVHATTRVIRPDGSSMSLTHAQAVLVEDAGAWHIAAFHNMIPAVP